ncbi:MAG: macro domain-containing protein, partial [Hellea sp.]
ENNLSSIVIPPISTGVYRFPANQAAKIAIDSVATALANSNAEIDVYFAMKEVEKYQIYHDALLKYHQ